MRAILVNPITLGYKIVSTGSTHASQVNKNIQVVTPANFNKTLLSLANEGYKLSIGR